MTPNTITRLQILQDLECQVWQGVIKSHLLTVAIEVVDSECPGQFLLQGAVEQGREGDQHVLDHNNFTTITTFNLFYWWVTLSLRTFHHQKSMKYFHYLRLKRSKYPPIFHPEIPLSMFAVKKMHLAADLCRCFSSCFVTSVFWGEVLIFKIKDKTQYLSGNDQLNAIKYPYRIRCFSWYLKTYRPTRGDVKSLENMMSVRGGVWK